MKETAAQLRDRIANLEAELERYKAIAAHYRASLGDVKANTILEPFFRSEMNHQRHRDKNSAPGWGALLNYFKQTP